MQIFLAASVVCPEGDEKVGECLQILYTNLEEVTAMEQMIDTARNMPTMPYVDVSEKQQEEITKTERMVKMLHPNVQRLYLTGVEDEKTTK